MATWAKCTPEDGGEILVNLDQVKYMIRESDYTIIRFSGDDSKITVKDTPGAIATKLVLKKKSE